jgi:cyclohexanecarboxylate-CoA ligase
MDLGVILSEDRIRAENARGFWPNRVITDYLDDAVRDAPDRIAIADVNSMTGAETVLTVSELRRRADRIALGLAALGVERGDVVSFQLPNWWEFQALVLAVIRIGAITNPLMPIFRDHELKFMLGLAGSKVLVVPNRFRDHDYPAMAERLRAELPALEHVLVVGGDGDASFERTLSERPWEDEMDADRIFAERRPSPNDVVQLLYTSGTTGEPKGVMHTSNTLLGTLGGFGERLSLGKNDVALMASPFAHQIGYLYGIVLSLYHGMPLVALDIWDPAKADELIEKWGVTYTFASTPFLADLTDVADDDRHDIRSLRIFVTAGAAIPRSLAKRATERLGAHVIAAWGMTENSATTTTSPGDRDEKVFGTDGIALPGMEVRVIDGAGRTVQTGGVGDLQVRGAANFVGYLKRPELYATDADGWLETGDLATMDKDGYIRIVGRSKDVIVRGGENIPVVEVEDLLYRHPDIHEVAIVAMPDERLGERACAFVVQRDGAALTLASVTGFLKEQQVATQYLPERLEIVDAMPRTPSGKIQKFRLREIARNFTVQKKPSAVTA